MPSASAPISSGTPVVKHDEEKERNRIALLADGRMFTAGKDGKASEHHCDFAETIERREQQSASKNAWLRGGDASAGAMFSRGMLWGGRAGPGSVPVRPRIVTMAEGESPDSMIYVLWTGIVGALLEFDFSENYERRVFHREGFQVSDLDRCPSDGRLACCIGHNGLSHLSILDADGRNPRNVTEGDSIDAAPSWVRGGEHALVYHSAGVSRDSRGFIRGLGPFGIHKLDLSNGRLETLLESSSHDLLSPHADASGTLHFIRRGYEGPNGPRVSAWVTLKDTLLLPYRMLRAFVDFFQIFSHLVSKKPLTTAGGPKIHGQEPLHMWVHGRMIDLSKSAGAGAADGAIAPADWELIRRDPDGGEVVLANHVLCYDIAADGSIAWSDGRNLHLITSEGGKRRLLSEPMTDTVKFI